MKNSMKNKNKYSFLKSNNNNNNNEYRRAIMIIFLHGFRQAVQSSLHFQSIQPMFFELLYKFYAF